MRFCILIAVLVFPCSLFSQPSEDSTAIIVNSGNSVVSKDVLLNRKDSITVSLRPGEALKIQSTGNGEKIVLEAYSVTGVSKVTGRSVFAQISEAGVPIVGVSEAKTDQPENITSANVKFVFRAPEIESIEVR